MANFSGHSARRYPDWAEVLRALRSGHYAQGAGGMCMVTEVDIAAPAQPIAARFDVLGVINDLAGADWELHADVYACDQDGETELPDIDILKTLGLDREVTEEELEDSRYGGAFQYFWYEILGEDEPPRRVDVLVFLNDELGGHAAVAEEVERLKWNA